MLVDVTLGSLTSFPNSEAAIPQDRKQGFSAVSTSFSLWKQAQWWFKQPEMELDPPVRAINLLAGMSGFTSRNNGDPKCVHPRTGPAPG
jgi:hypothetical protein